MKQWMSINDCLRMRWHSQLPKCAIWISFRYILDCLSCLSIHLLACVWVNEWVLAGWCCYWQFSYANKWFVLKTFEFYLYWICHLSLKWFFLPSLLLRGNQIWIDLILFRRSIQSKCVSAWILILFYCYNSCDSASNKMSITFHLLAAGIVIFIY